MTTLRQSKAKFYVLVRERGGHRSGLPVLESRTAVTGITAAHERLKADIDTHGPGYRVVIEPAEFIAAEEEGEER